MTRTCVAIAVVLGVALLSEEAEAFRPLCSSLGSGGGQFDDGCGPCSVASAARWEPASITFRFDRASVPSAGGVSEARFASDIANVIAAWNASPGSTLAITDGGNASSHDFGDDPSVQEVWWAVDDAEWIETTGTAPNGGALGITEPRYSCDLDDDGRREPWFDADIILNGTPGGGFTWNCAGLDCPSSTSVLLHEIGHALGLGHPCSECEDAAMGATLIVSPVVPLPDDVLSLASLYPDSGALGAPCASSSECASGTCGSFAMPSGNLAYCTQSCGACPAGFTCSSGQCEIASAVDAVLPDVGGACAFTCVDDCFAFGGPDVLAPGCNACLVGNDDVAACVKGCSRATGAGCDLASEFCSGVGSGDDQGACKPRRGEGGACNDDSLCIEGLRCVNGACRSPCTLGDPATCAPGQECVDDGAGPTCRGGLEGESCAAPSDCASGFTCTGFDPFFCFRDCDVAGPACPDDEVCAVIGDLELCIRTRGFGESCAEFNVFCADGADCIDPVSGPPLCSRPCDLANGSGCESGEACVDVAGEGLCLPDGGAEIGEPCATSSDCAAAALCHETLCTARCDLDVPCAFGSLCIDVTEGRVCIDDVTGEGEGEEGEGEEGEGEGEEPSEGEGEGPEGCTCATSSPTSALAFALALIVRARRRRRASATSSTTCAALRRWCA